MRLKSLEIQGFKTFPDKTKLSFEQGITAVVGPNGSGKSNISDAIRWVLGEQSPKSLRCSKMEDVVFNGTDKRKKLGYAEVSLNIENKDRVLAFDGDEISITRRYYRSGESEYLINKAQVRLKDINELFMDTGLGRDGYSMIGQGKIDSIVSSKGEDRREIFEEAAGISRYRYRKTDAERKLKSTEENLLRLRDIVTELEERVGPLKRQSEKAQEFLKYSEEKRGLEIALWLLTLEKSQAALKTQDEKIAIAHAQYDDAEKNLKYAIEIEDMRMMDYSIRLSRYRNYLLVCRMMKLNKDTNQKMIMMNEEYSKVKMKLENSQLKMLEVLSLLAAIIGLMIAGISFSLNFKLNEAIILICVLNGLVFIDYGLLRSLCSDNEKKELKYVILVGLLIIAIGLLVDIFLEKIPCFSIKSYLLALYTIG